MKSCVVALWLSGAVAFASAALGAQEPQNSKQAVEKRLKKTQKEGSSLVVERAIQSLSAANRFAQVAISPDGKKVAWVEEWRDREGGETGNSTIWASTADGKAAARKISVGAAAPRAEKDIAWAPDSRRLAFLSDAEKP